MPNRTTAVWTTLLIAALAAVVWVVLRCGKSGGEESRHPQSAEVRGTSGPRRPGRAAVPAVPQRGAAHRPKPVLSLEDDDDDDNRAPEEKSLAARIEKALDDEDFEAAAVCAGEALKCGDAEIRQAMVDTLGWFGKKALPELAPFLSDSDSDVRESAMSEWSMALASIEDDEERLGTVELAIGILSDEDSLEELSNEYIGVDEKLAVESLARIINGGGSAEGVEKAKETYEFVTGDEWVGEEEARRWIAEEYEPGEIGG